MKIEKINENQIRCTLTKEDLADRDINISELAYGSGKTKELFQDMMRKANDDFGFEVNDIPLMVEAIPVSPESIILVITKVESPEETEEHLSKFFSKDFKEKFKEGLRQTLEDHLDLSDIEEMENIFQETKTESDSDSLLYSIYSFKDLSTLMNVAKTVSPAFEGDSAVYKSPENNNYYLCICMESKNEAKLNKICSVLTEQGKRENPTYAKELFYIEHFDHIIEEHAIEKLATI